MEAGAQLGLGREIGSAHYVEVRNVAFLATSGLTNRDGVRKRGAFAAGGTAAIVWSVASCCRYLKPLDGRVQVLLMT